MAISLTAARTPYKQNFDTLAATGTSTALPTDWFFLESAGATGNTANQTYTAGTGSSTTGDTYSFGALNSTDRALGQLRSGSVTTTIGAQFTNNTGQTLSGLQIGYTGEQWRFGAAHTTIPDKLNFQISFDATSLATGTWLDVDPLDFNAPVTGGTVGPLDGNAAANRTILSFLLSNLNIAAGATFWIRWVDVDATSSDDGLAIDDFSIEGIAATPAVPVLSINDVSQNEDAGVQSFTVSLSAPAGSGGVSFDIATADGTATVADGDYAAKILTGQVIPEGASSYTFSVTVNTDRAIESNETFAVTVSNITGATAGDTQGQGTIVNDDAPGAISVADVSVTEGDSGTTAAAFTLTRSGGSTGTVTVDYLITLPGGAGGADSNDVSATLSGTVTFIDGQTSATIPFSVKGDVNNEPNETFTVTLSNPTGGATISDNSGVATITNDDAPPAATIADATIAEGRQGISYLSFTVTLSKPSPEAVTINYATSNGTASAGSDYLAASGQISFAAGETMKTITVPIVGDTAPEANETFNVTLSSPVGATLADGAAIGTITNDDGPGYYSLASGTFSENWTDTSRITTNDDWSRVQYIVGYLGDYTADAPTGVDPRTLTAAATLGAVDVIANLPSTTSTSGGVGEFEISNPTIGLQGSGTADAPSIVLYMDASGRSEIHLKALLRDIDGSADNAVQSVNVQYRTDPNGPWINVEGGYFADVTTGGSATQETVLDIILPAGANNAATLQIRILTTNAAGSDEWVGIDDILVSSNPAAPSYSVADAAVFEGTGGGSTPIAFTVTRAGDTSQAGTVDYSVGFAGGGFSADASDFASPLVGTVQFAAGETTKTITLQVAPDANPEADEAFTVTLSNPSTGGLGDRDAVGTIVNDDASPPFLSISDVTQAEGNSGTTLFTFTVTRTGGMGSLTVDYATTGTGTAGSDDYSATSGTLTFQPGETVKTFTVSVNGDTQSERAETFGVQLSNATGFAVITDGEATGTIQNDDLSYIHDIQGTSYYSPILAAEGKNGFNIASTTTVIIQAVVTALDGVGTRQGFFITEETEDWDAFASSSEGIYVMTRNDSGAGDLLSVAAPTLKIGDIVTITAQVMEYQYSSTMSRTMLVNASSIVVNSSGAKLPILVLDASHPIPNSIMTAVTPDYTDSSDDAGDTFDMSLYALSFFESVEGMLVTIPDMVVADGFVQTSGGRPYFKAYSTVHADADQINSRGGYTVAGDPPLSPPETPETDDATIQGGRHLHDGDVNPDIIEIDFSDFAVDAPAGLTQNATMGDKLGDVTGIIDFAFTDLKLFVTAIDPAKITNTVPVQETTALGGDSRALTVATFNVENLDPGDGQARFDAIASVIAKNLNGPDIISIEEMQDNNGADPSGGSDASTTWNMLVAALNAAIPGAKYQWVDQAPVAGREGGEPGGNIRVGFLYNTNRVQLGDLPADASLAERRQFTDRIGDGLRDAGDRIAFSDDMVAGEINTADWSNTRLSLLGQFTFHGNTVFVTANHLPAKGGSGEFWQVNQNIETGEPDNGGWAKRNAVAQDIYAVLNHIQANSPNAGIIAGGDFNDFYFYRPLEVATGYVMADGTPRLGGARFDNLTVTELTEAERYSYTFDGRSQAIDHIIVNQRLSAVASYDIVHINTGYNSLGTGANANPAISDHDPAISSFDFRGFDETLTGTPGNDTLDGMGGNDTILLNSGGDDTAIGGDGNDFFYYGAAFTNADSNDGGAGTDRLGLGGQYNLTFDANDLVSIERLELYGSAAVGGTGPFNYTLTTIDANVADNTTLFVTAASLSASEKLAFNGMAETNGRFLIQGGAGADTIVGGALGDHLIGNAGNDQLYGMGGNDILHGGGGADQLRGGYGADTFLYLSASESGTAPGTSDRITDFEVTTDKIDLSAIDATNAAGDQAFEFIGTAAFTHAGQLRSTWDSSANAWRVEGDIDGDTIADFTIFVVTPGQVPLSGGDFVL